MNSKRKSLGTQLLVFLPLIVLLALILLIAVPLFAFGHVDAMIHGPKIVMSLASPDGKHEAYVEEGPSIDPPNQTLFVERSEKSHFMHIADLAEDIDAIQEIAWSPDSQIVIFHSRHCLTATRVADWLTVRIYLGKEWRRTRPQRYPTTFSAGGARQEVKAIAFPESGGFKYRIKGEEKFRKVRLDGLAES